MRRRLLFVPAVLFVAACSSSDKSAPKADSTAAPAAPAGQAAPAPEPPKLSAAHQSVIKRLNQDGLISIPEVKAKSDELMAQIRDNKMTISQGAEVFDKWLTEYIASHPKEVEQAKSARAMQLEQAQKAAAAGQAPMAPVPGTPAVKPPTP